MKRLLALSLLFSGSIIASPSPEEMRVLRSDQQSFVIEFRPAYLPLQMVREGSVEFVRFDFKGSTIGDETALGDGLPEFRERLFTLGFPSPTGNTLQVIAADYFDSSGVNLAPVPLLGDNDGMVGVERYEPDQQAYATNRFLPETTVRMGDVGRVRSMYVGNIGISPIQYNPATRTVRRYSRIVVEVLFGSPREQPVASGDEKILGSILLNGEAAKNWQFAGERGTKRVVGPSVLALGFWYKIPVTEEGVYIIDSLYLRAAGLDPAEIDPRTVKIYGNGGAEVPELVTAPRPEDLVENAIFVQGEADGRFNENDFIIFYGRSVRGWKYNPATRLFDHSIHHYSSVNYYWFTYGGVNGKRMQLQESVTGPATVVPDRFTSLVLVDEDTINLLLSGKDWYGPTINANSSMLYVNPVPGIVPSTPITYRWSMVARSVGHRPVLTVQEGSTIISQELLPSVPTGDDYTAATEKTTRVTVSPPILDETSQVSFAFSSAVLSSSAWLNWLEIQYPSSFSATGNYLRFRSPDTTGVVEYRLGGFTATPIILEVTNPFDARIINGVSGSYTFRADEVADSIAEYCAVGAGAYKVPGTMQFVTNQDLRGITEGYDFIIVTTREFRSAADRLAAFREQPAHGDLRTLVADVDQIYNEFSGGVPDITAIRDFLRYAAGNWVRVPTFVLFFGQGSYDYKSRLGFRSSFVPAWQSAESRYDLTSYSSDDFFVRFGTTSTPSLVSGRLNARSSAEAEQLVDRLISYDNQSVRDPWKMRILIVGDDSWTSEREDGTIHSAQAEALAELDVPDVFEKRKIYIAEYPTVITGQGRRKPAAYQAIIDEINRGALIVNYTGHGNPTVWAHESVFSVQTSIPQLFNTNRLSMFFLATCNFSQFDDPTRYTGAELLVNRAEGGAIGVVSATRKVFAVENFQLNRDIYQRMFLEDQFARPVVDRPAAALFRAKVEASNSINDQKFFFMGDPTMRLQFPAGHASIDSINGEAVDSVGGLPASDADPIQIKALQKVKVRGTVRDENNMPDTLANATMTLVVNDATGEVSIAGFPVNCSINCFTYEATGGTIFRGANSITDGRFNTTFIVPKDISYADSTTRGRMVAYYTDGVTDGVAFTGRIYVGGTDSTAVPDNLGPAILLYLNTRSFRQGDMVSDDPLLLVDIEDSSGINTSTSRLGHRIEAWINQSALSVDVTDFYSSALDDYRRGTVQFQLTNLPFGRNTIRLRAWDAFNNATTTETFFDVTSGDRLTISDVLNYPNPFSRETAFTFKQNQGVPLNISIKIYTVAGRLIQTIDQSSPGEPFIQIPWDGRDRDGDVLANGVYLYKIIVSTVDGAYTSEALGKLSVLK